MIKIDKNMVDVNGNSAELITEITLGLKRCCMLMDREFVIPSVLSAIYAIPADPTEKIDIIKSLKDFKSDVSMALSFIEAYSKIEGDTAEEKGAHMENEHDGSVQGALDLLQKKIEERFGHEHNDN